MIQITGLTKVYRRGAPPAVLDLTCDVRPGMVTALLGPEDSGKSTALRLMLELERGQGVALFDGRTYRRLRRPEREVGAVLPDAGADSGAAGGSAVGHPGRKARGHLQMLAAAVGVPARRADELLEQTRLAAVAEQRLRAFSPGMHRRLALATALLGAPHTLLLDAPTEDLSPRNVEWFHAFLRSFAVAGGTVLVTTRSPQEAARLADRVVTLDQGRMVADQPVTEFRRTRLSPEVAVRGPQMARLADLLLGQGAEVRRDGGAGLAVAGIGRTEIGELAYRHGILLHELADRVVEQPAPRAVLPTASGRSGRVRTQPVSRRVAPVEVPQPASPAADPAAARTLALPALPAPAASTVVPVGTAAVPSGGAAAGAPAPTTAAVPAPTTGSAPSPVLAAASAPAPPGIPEPAPAPVGEAFPTPALPTVPVDRLFRHEIKGLPRRSAPSTGQAPGQAPGEAPGEGSDDAMDPLHADTLRLRRLTRLTGHHIGAPADHAPAPTPRAAPTSTPPTPDHRSE